jgi:hypothetical protein
MRRFSRHWERLIGTVLTLGTPQDVTLQELRVEMFMPADDASEATLVELGRGLIGTLAQAD